MNLRTYNASREIDRILSMLGIIFSIILIGLFIDKIAYVLTGFLVLISCIIWLFIRKNATIELDFPSSNFINLKLSSFFFIILALSILSIHLRPVFYERPLIYYLLVSIMVGVVALEVMYSQRVEGLILLQIIIIGISIAWSQLLIFPSLVGVDPWYHQALTLEIIHTNFIPSGYGYSKLPIFHLLIASTSLITGLNYKYSTMLSVSLAQIICNCLFIFLLGKFLFKNSKIGLLASLFLIISDQHIYMSYWSIPNSFAAIFIPIIFYLSFKMISEMQVRRAILLIISMVAIILTHSVTSMCTSIMLFVSWLVSILYNVNLNKKSAVSLNFFVLFSTFMFGWWTFASGHIQTLAQLINWGFSPNFFTKTPLELISYDNIPILETIIPIFGPYLFIALSLIGLFYMISKYGNYFTFNMGLVGSVPLILGFSSVITQRSILLSRWFYFLQICYSILLAVSIAVICNSIKRNMHKQIFIKCISMIFFIIMIINPTSSGVDNIFTPHISARASLTTSELQTIKWASNFGDEDIITDNYLANSQSFIYDTKSFDNEVYNKKLYDLRGNLILIREDIINKPFRMFNSIVTLGYNLKSAYIEEGFYQVYDCGSANILR